MQNELNIDARLLVFIGGGRLSRTDASFGLDGRTPCEQPCTVSGIGSLLQNDRTSSGTVAAFRMDAHLEEHSIAGISGHEMEK
ncbi:hypothetical protein F511_26703 [Dorcoceras hygrometricum]|uniref:Uncharacterized protein n=1 Tax=Dorcoceras hygrometricum TaxID=472368 RepID=A0A2Z7BYN3_9LAMI|nr:hypothetical protein F511_26703 [Dorcoceras hygrometricum]